MDVVMEDLTKSQTHTILTTTIPMTRRLIQMLLVSTRCHIAMETAQMY